jgi:hypothetical protein
VYAYICSCLSKHISVGTLDLSVSIPDCPIYLPVCISIPHGGQPAPANVGTVTGLHGGR